MKRIPGSVQRSIGNPSSSRVKNTNRNNTVYENAKSSKTKPLLSSSSQINGASMFATKENPQKGDTLLAAKEKAKSTLVTDMETPDIVSVTTKTTKALIPYTGTTNQVNNQAIHKDSTDVSPESKKTISEHFFGNKNEDLEKLNPKNPFFLDYRKNVLKEKPDAPLTLETLIKYSNFVHKIELELGQKFAIISSIDSIYEDAGVFRPKNPIAGQISASEYLQAVWEMTDAEKALFEIFSKEYVDNHLSFFENGSVTNVRSGSYLNFMKKSMTVGRADEGERKGGRWVQPKDTLYTALQYQKDNPHLSLENVLTTKLGWRKADLENNLLLAVIDDNTSVDQLEMPTRKHLGVNDFFFDGGHTHGTLEREAIAPVIEKDKVAIGIWGLPDDHPLHPFNVKPGNYLEVDEFLSSKANVEDLMKSMRRPLQEFKPSDL
jgi:hypothetical protein